MGLCLCGDDQTNQEIERNMGIHHKTDQMVKKLLLLGSGESGKSTLFKQLQHIYMPSDNLNDIADIATTRLTIRQTMLENINIVLKNAALLYHRDKETYANLFFDMTSDRKIARAVEVVAGLRDVDTSRNIDVSAPSDKLKEIGESVGICWDLPAVRDCHKLRGKFYNLDDTADYFFDRAEVVFSAGYTPNFEDMLRSRYRSVGISKKTFEIKENVFDIYDAGGQRAERKKWIHHFDGVQAVIFVAALNHYCARLYEDERVNAMHESIKLFGKTCNDKHFENTEMILFLNKNDLFFDRLREGTSLRMCFHTDAGWNGDQWDADKREQNDPKGEYEVVDYAPPEIPTEEDNNFFQYCYQQSLAFIEYQYTKVNANEEKMIYVHVTTATNEENVSKVFWDVQNMVIRNNLRRGGIV
eukprot:CAMPEP_0202695126 /NCGR_PEP_ID=MMETSP1385-20130828/8796_1 /ASSEMBLY_ACC=CAM_ASM_000861 /TAXON_ID=933848 /ORGANISM="Elphidium margaritaceum" /LENGTH=413 /DNA_ID=CAMNT_0049351095 /DNA_START=29 /DNA_END=1270 /DNA_ORIENTATION=+